MGKETSVLVGPSRDARARQTKIASKSDLYHMKIILQIRTRSMCSINHFGELGGGTHLAMPKTILPDSSSLKPGSGATEGVLDKGCPGGQTIPSAGLLDYEDTRLKTLSRVRMGLSVAWKASLAMRIFKISYHCNRLCVTLTLSGVYINRRVFSP